MGKTGNKPNRLIEETSPYLQQHAYNPVDWYPWGQEALELARQQDKPILLSIGYAACHWCHVMERESFEDEAIAAIMNEKFVCVKVDREERPEIDAIYMDAVQAMTGQGGWPMTMFLTPQGEPFFGGTYFPPEDRHGLPSFRKVLQSIAETWETRRSEVLAQGTKLTGHIKAQTEIASSAEPLSSGLISSAARDLVSSVDPVHGGFGRAPKFPQAPAFEFMLRASAAGVPEVGKVVYLTLEKMATGGIYDQLGGGFHRYSVDAAWLVPHFEKMLYDNAQLARLYIHAWQATGRALYRRVATETLQYLLRDMRSPEGAFYSSEDADSEGIEGKFYVWDYNEFTELAPEAIEYFGVSSSGNFEGVNILTGKEEEPPHDLRNKLLDARSARVRPGRDEKILTSWNGLVISALAEAGAVFSRPDLVQAAVRAGEFILEHSRNEQGRLMHSYKDGRAKVLGLLEDYAFLGEALLNLWEVTFDPRWMEETARLVNQMVDLFWDKERGGFFTTGSDHERLVMRPKEVVESATPSPNTVASLLMQKVSVISGDRDLHAKGVEVLRMARALMEGAPQAVPSSLSALDFYLSPTQEIAIIGDRNDPRTAGLKAEVWRPFIPNKVLAGAPPGIDSPLLEGKSQIDGLPTAFVCQNYVCRQPVTTPEQLAIQLARRPQVGSTT